MKLSVVIIAKDEAATIQECIRSVIVAVERARAVGRISSSEIILVDSASTDDTVELARSFPIRILRLARDIPLSAAAGSYVGLLHSSGDVVGIVNADVVVDPEWFAEALPFMRGNVGAVLGIALERFRGFSFTERTLLAAAPEVSEGYALPARVKAHSGGASAGTLLVKDEAIRRAGAYNPFLVAAEDFDLRLRLERLGYRVLNIPVVQGEHFWSEPGGHLVLSDILWTLFRNSIGLGQVLRLRWGDRSLGWTILRKCVNLGSIRAALLAIALLMVFALSTVGLLRSDYVALVVAALTVISLAAATRWSRRRAPLSDHFIQSLFPGMLAIVRCLGLARGFARRPLRADSFPLKVDEIPSRLLVEGK